ncbi:hypothetical protein G7Z17_g6070 [Cylindrodendrum hubeiense]|uniref:Phytocyanin domain-containing protein n=1 Tax=Cylindrodendrum hubeiense TaxID=595255 RepID=A0A9P5H7X2_9HYPO|nr:hypothetical protein G7Z17_g6070 [Cylindrodendrum hubeiense]
MHSAPIITLSALVSAVAAAKHVVKVGDGGLTFDPESTTAAVGDTVEFHFYPMAHSVAQSSFAAPCEPLNSTSFFSGPVAVSSGVSDTVFTVTIENEDPIWYYCATGSHCQSGMVGAINAATTGSKTVKKYAEAAADASDNVAPSSTGGGTLGEASTATASSTNSATSGAAASATESSGSNAGLEARGDIRWGLMSAGIAMAGLVAGFMI